MKKTVLVVLIGLIWNATAHGYQQRTPADADAEANVLLAARLAEIAQNTLRGRLVVEPTWKLSAAFLEAAARLDPQEPRYPRMLAEARLQARDTAGAIAAFNAYRQLEPQDRWAQIQLIELHVGRMETADEREDYLRDLVERTAIPEEVRAHAAAKCARLLIERGQPQQGREMLFRALSLNPVSFRALGLRQELAEGVDPVEHAAALLGLLRANPAQPRAMDLLARELAAVGLSGPAAQWSGNALGLYQRMMMPVPQDFAQAYAEQLFVSGEPQLAEELLSQLVQINPQDANAWFTRLAVHRQFGQREQLDQVRRQALNAMLNQLALVRQEAGLPGAQVRDLDDPPPVELPDYRGDIQRILENDRVDLIEPYVSAVVDLAWFQIYFNNRASSGRRLVDLLREVLPEGHVTLARLEGWSYLIEDRHEEARRRLMPVAEYDPLAAMGAIIIEARDPAEQQVALRRATRLLSSHPSGLMGAMLWDGLRAQGAEIVPGPQASAISREMEEFPRDLLRIIDRPHEFYALRGTPVRVTHAYGEPILARITIQNISDYDLTIGPNGIIRPDLWFDAQLRGLATQTLPGIAYDRLTHHVVLRPRQTLTQVVRIDQGFLSQLLASNPSIAFQIAVHVMTNPTTVEQGIASTAGGYRVQFNRMIERSGFALGSDDARRRVYTALADGPAGQRFRFVELLAGFTRVFASEQAPEQLRQQALEFAEIIRRAGRDPSPSVSAWANYQISFMAEPQAREQIVQMMARHPQWEHRMLAISAARTLPLEQQRQAILPMARDDEDPVVRAAAEALLEFVQIAAQVPVEHREEEIGPTGPVLIEPPAEPELPPMTPQLPPVTPEEPDVPEQPIMQEPAPIDLPPFDPSPVEPVEPEPVPVPLPEPLP